MAETTAVTVMESSMALAQAKAEIDTQIATAKMYPRDEGAAIDKAVAMATRNKDIAAACSYTAPWDKSITGPSVRLAEIIASKWGNMRIREWIVEVNERDILAEAYCHDLESNLALGAQCRRSIWGKRGRYNEQTINTTCAAAMAIARRNAIFKVIPRAAIDEIREYAIDCALSGGSKEQLTDEERRTKCVEYFEKLGVTKDELLDYLSKSSVDDITTDDVSTLLGVATAVREKETTLDAVFRPKNEMTKDPDTLESLWEQIAEFCAAHDPANELYKKAKATIAPEVKADADITFPQLKTILTTMQAQATLAAKQAEFV